MTLVVDANVVFDLVSGAEGFGWLRGREALAPPVLWPEVRSSLHVARWRGLLDHGDAAAALAALDAAPVKERRHRRLGSEAWRIADELRWARTYDAEYLALAHLLRVPLASFDRRVARAAERVGIELHTFA